MALAFAAHTASAQSFHNLTPQQVKTDSIVPSFSQTLPLTDNFRDSIYTVSIAYPEFIDMPAEDVGNYKKLCPEPPPEMPEVETSVVFDRKKPFLSTTFCPVVFRDGRYRLLVSFMLKKESAPEAHAKAPLRAEASHAQEAASRYAEHSVLATGRWAKISVPSTGVYQLTDALIRQAGFTDLSKVKIYGYGGNLRSEKLDGDDISAHDDLKEVPTYNEGGRRLFHALGPVSWTANTTTRRTRNPYSDYGYYFITQSDDEPATADSATFVSSFYPSPTDYHTHYEIDGYSWYNGGRNLFDTHRVDNGASYTIKLGGNTNATTARLSVNVSTGTSSAIEVAFNDSVVGTISTTLADANYITACQRNVTYNVKNLSTENSVKFTVKSGGPLRLDFATLVWNNPQPAPDIKQGTFPTPQYVYNITNQDHHADSQADMVIIIPTSQKLLKQAQRLKEFHEKNDSMRVNIVPADELYNEFSSGTPDASAYRLYMKMLYDRAQSEADMPKYLLLLGDCVWDNRMLTSACRSLSPDDYLLVYESEDSFDKRSCYLDDGFFGMLDDGEGLKPLYKDKLDIAIGRFPVTTEAEAKIIVDKTISYAENKNGGAWQNTIFFMGDDGDSNQHMDDANQVADQVISAHPGFLVKKVMWDSYTRETSSTGNTYPEVSRLIKQQQQQGALVMDYAGHGSATQLSHEKVLLLSDFEAFKNTNLPLWVTASCDIMPFDGTTPTVGETAMLNEKGGAVAFYGTTRTVYAAQNTILNKAFMRHVLSYDSNGRPLTIGEAQRLAKNGMTNESLASNSLQYSLLGDPALALRLPTLTAKVDEINGTVPGSGSDITLKAGSLATIKGHIEGGDNFNGVATITVRDNRELVVCRLNDKSEAEEAFTYYDRPNTIYSGSDSVRAGRFEITFPVPKDINYSNETGLINIHAINTDHTISANGYEQQFIIGGSDIADNDSIGPSIFCYLNSPSFANGGNVNSTPYFVAEIKDKDGINAAGNGVGHDMQLVIDGKLSATYSLNDNFSYDFGSYTSGTTHYNIPELTVGKHKLLFRAWDVLNNVSIAELDFNVVKGLKPQCSIDCTKNPATESTTFIITHDRNGSELTVGIDVFDVSGRQLWRHDESGESTGNTYTIDWDLTTDSGGRLQTGVYLYRVRLTSEGGTRTSKAKKLVVTGNK